MFLANFFNIEGIGDEVILTFLAVVVLVLACSIYQLRRSGSNHSSRMVHPEERDNVNSVRESIAGVNGAVPPRRFDSGNTCPVCLNEVQFAVETNCGHVFCGRCMIAYRHHGNRLGAVRCPVCRQQVTILFQLFTEDVLNTAEIEVIEQRNNLQREIGDYNRRFSGAVRPLMDYILDLPTILRHLWNEFFSVGGLVHMFRIRIILCLLAAFTYLISPLDILPEAVFGILGLLDDLFVFLLLAIYVSIIYRSYLANRQYPGFNIHQD